MERVVILSNFNLINERSECVIDVSFFGINAQNDS